MTLTRKAGQQVQEDRRLSGSGAAHTQQPNYAVEKKLEFLFLTTLDFTSFCRVMWNMVSKDMESKRNLNPISPPYLEYCGIFGLKGLKAKLSS